LGDVNTWLSFVRERSGTVDTDLSSYSLRSQPALPEPRPPLQQRPTASSANVNKGNPLTTSLDSVEWNKHAPNAKAGRPTLQDEANDRGVMMAMREDVDKLAHQLDSTLDDIYQMEVGNGVIGGQIPRTNMAKSRRPSAPPRILTAPVVKIARQQSPRGQENEKERTPRTKMKRLLQIQEQSWSPSSRTATANLSKVKPEVFTKSKKKINAEARRKQEARSRELSNPNRYKKNQLENLARMGGGGDASDEEGESDVGDEDDQLDDKTPNVSVSFADEGGTAQVYDDSLFDLLEELESVEN
jgi:hypothetical protein